MSLRYAYNTNGLQSHRLDDACALLADTGYDGVALTLDVAHLDPLAPDLPHRARRLADRLDALGLATVVETGARYVLDPRRKHEPTLVSDDAEGRAERVRFLGLAIDVAATLGAESVNLFSGISSHPDARDWLLEGLEQVADLADRRGVVVSLEPEPGHVVGDLDGFLAVTPPEWRCALDVGHCLVTGERDPADAVAELAPRLGSVSLDDMRTGDHTHLAFGEGDLNLPGVLEALTEVGWEGLCCVELSRDSHRAHELVPASLRALREAEPG